MLESFAEKTNQKQDWMHRYTSNVYNVTRGQAGDMRGLSGQSPPPRLLRQDRILIETQSCIMTAHLVPHDMLLLNMQDCARIKGIVSTIVHYIHIQKGVSWKK